MNTKINRQEQPKKEKRPPTLKDIALRAGVSAATVSVILSDGPKAKMYSMKTRRKIWDYANEMGYLPNLLARSLKSGKSGLIGVVMSSQHSTYYGRPLQAAEKYAQEVGYELITADMNYDFSKFEQCIQMMTAWNVEGLLLMTGGKLINTSMNSMLQSTGIPYVKGGVYHPDDSCSTIVFNSYDAGRVVARHLFELGHREIGILAAHTSNAASTERLRGVASMAREMDIPESALHVMHVEGMDVGFKTGYEMMKKILKKYPSLSAVLLHSDKMAIGAIRLLHEQRIQIPKDISVAGFDDVCMDGNDSDADRIGTFLWPSLTTVRTPLDEIGIECIRLLLDMIREPSLRDTPRTIVFPPTLVVRESTGQTPLKKLRIKKI
jgi:LacI family transcriptional regulator